MEVDEVLSIRLESLQVVNGHVLLQEAPWDLSSTNHIVLSCLNRGEAISSLVGLLTGYELKSEWGGEFSEIVAEEGDDASTEIGSIGIEPCSLRPVV